MREEIPKDDKAAYTLPITQAGVRIAREWGTLCGNRLQTLQASPLIRCIQTAQAISEGAGVKLPVVKDHLLGSPGVFIYDEEQSKRNWIELGHERIMKNLVSEDFPLPGMSDPKPAAYFLIKHMLAVAEQGPGIHIFVTHDSLITATSARFLGQNLGSESWPYFLEGAFFWKEGNQVHMRYKDKQGQRPFAEFLSLDKRSVINFARWEISWILGKKIPARFFLAGGAFKSLLTGLPPKDLDLWAPSALDREALRMRLLERDAQKLTPTPFSERFKIHGRMVDLPFKVMPSSLEKRLARFDLGLSAIGVEHLPHGKWKAMIHPLARKSMEQRKIFLLKPLVNWKFALGTLERMHRYAHELGYVIPQEEENEVWKIFDAQSEKGKREMIKNFEQISEHQEYHEILSKALKHFR